MISLPIQAKTTRDTQKELVPPPKKNAIILVIDDDIVVRELLKADLGRLGYAVAVAEDGNQGIELTHKIHPDAIVLDVLMPEKDGWEVLSIIKNDPLLAPIPVIMTSIDVNKKRASAMGAADCIDKKLLHSQLAAMLEKYKIGFSEEKLDDI
jgi:CheY-like chemotaxis protein